MTAAFPPSSSAHFSPEAEQQIVGALLDGASGFSLIARNGGIDLFADPLHREIYRTVEKKANAGELVSLITIKAAMESCPVLAEYGGPAYLVRAAGAYLGHAAIGGYVEMLSELARKRHLSRAIADAQSALATGEETADRVAARLETAIIAAESSGGSQKPVGMLAAVTAAVEQARAAYHGETDDVVKSGIPALDKIVPGFYPGELTLIGGRPSMGKSAVALAIALNVARAGHGVAIASLEMTPEAMAARALSEATAHARNAVPYTSMRRGDMTEAQFKAVVEEAQFVAKLPITFLPRAYADLGALISGARQVLRATQNLRLLIIDYAQLLKADGRSRYDEITAISMALKALAVSMNIPVIALSQLSRQLENRDDKRPQMSDLRESGQLEQDADNVMFCYRPEYYLERKKPEADDPEAYSEWEALMAKHRHALEIIVAKQRMGQIGTAHVKFAPAVNKIWED
ncbi:replicative DNA helicase [Paracoccus kondratievae]|uniref:DNA 5'-3' helicase n=1 Tax=Paracoccus kondratievae TaxID=135740 RepID=A0AAD3NX06_9RHOB|nr:DnaB-like helicase C-terminal domain-containing protein [Paracoccus kondratievae]AZV00257.1 replicative DNA helicase [Paracoccus phage vB_PkoS_Pkon1]GLK63492.1 replicative DNA helicase [Paracoccus kondratievae]